jgi:hypothetical protein
MDLGQETGARSYIKKFGSLNLLADRDSTPFYITRFLVAEASTHVAINPTRNTPIGIIIEDFSLLTHETNIVMRSEQIYTPRIQPPSLYG